MLRELVAAAGESDGRMWIIHGEPGSGKTTLITHWVHRWVAGLTNPARDGMLVPVRVRFRDLPPAAAKASPNQLALALWERIFAGELGPRYGARRLAPESVLAMPVWLLDGWDEADSEEFRTEGFLDRLRNVPGLKLITCRSAILESLRVSTPLDIYADECRTYALRNFDPREQLAFLRNRLINHPGKARKLYAKLQKHTQLTRISTSPLLLSQIADMSSSSGGQHEDLSLPRSRSEFYQGAIGHMWLTKLHGLSATDSDAQLRDEILEALAGRIGLVAEIGRTEVINTIRRHPHNPAPDRLLDQLSRAGILSRSWSGAYAFVHLTFQEFYLARWLESEGFESVLEQRWDDARYDEVLALMMARLVESGGATTVEKVLTRFVEKGQEWFDREPQDLYECGRSPLRTAIRLVNRSGVPDQSLPSLVATLWSLVGRSLLRKLTMSRDPETIPALLANLAMDADEDVRRNSLVNPNTPRRVIAMAMRLPGERSRATKYASTNGSPTLIAELATWSDVQIQRLVARNPFTSNVVLGELFSHLDVEVRRAVAGNRNADEEILEALARDEDNGVRLAVAGNHSVPHDVLCGLSNDSDPLVRQHVACSRKAPPEILVRLSIDADHDVVAQAALNRSTPVTTLVDLVASEDNTVLLRIAQNEVTPAAVLEKVAELGDETTRAWVVRHGNAPPSLVSQLVANGGPMVDLEAARSPVTPAAALAELARREDAEVLKAVAGNPNTPLEVLHDLATRGDDEIRAWVGANPSTDDGTLRYLFGLGNDEVHLNLGSRPNAPASLLMELAEVGAERIRMGPPLNRLGTFEDYVLPDHHELACRVASNVNTPVEVLTRLVQLESRFVKASVASNLGTPLEMLFQLADTGDDLIEDSLARNRNTPAELLVKLAKDGTTTWLTARRDLSSEALQMLVSSLARGRSRVDDMECKSVADHPNTLAASLAALAQRDQAPLLYLSRNPRLILESV